MFFEEERKRQMDKTMKHALLAAAAAAVGGVALAAGLRRKKERSEQWEESIIRENLGVTMSAGDLGDDDEEKPLQVVKILPSGPRTARVRPTEEEAKEILRQKLEKVIRF